jgi:Bacterial regulatory protein, arsR family
MRNSILTSLADPEMRKILDSVMINPKSVNEISRETSIANTTTYRKIKWMVEEGLLIVSSIQITDEGKKTSLFRSTLRSLNIEYTSGEIKIKAERNVDVFERTAEDFFSLT